MKILITGFDPFGGASVNPALEAVKKLDGRVIEEADIVALEIPTVRWKSLERIKEAIKAENPQVVLSVGQAGGRFQITPERVAINVDDFRIEDNDGNQPCNEPVAKGAPNAYWSTLPIKAMVTAMKKVGTPAVVSNSAGTFVCNHVFYGLMHMLAEEGNVRRGGFIHIPYLPEQVLELKNQPSMAIGTIVKGLEAALAAIVLNEKDEKRIGGSIC